MTPIARLLPVAGLLLASCTTVSSGITPDAAGDGYVLTERASPLAGGGAAAGRTALAKADTFCRDRGQRLLPLESEDFGWPIQRLVTGPTGTTLSFRCAAPRDRQLNVGEP
jgi:hypothetical protein